MNGDGIIKVQEFSENSGIVFHAKQIKIQRKLILERFEYLYILNW